METNSSYISENIARYRRSGRFRYLARAAWLVLQQGRLQELLYGLYCRVVARPAGLSPTRWSGLADALRSAQASFATEEWWRRDALVEQFNADFAIDLLPSDFEGCRREAIVVLPDRLILGEYGERKRLADITRAACSIHSHYDADARVRHIHAIHPGLQRHEYIVTTGDAAKYLDIWLDDHGALQFSRRVQSALAGHTALAMIKGVGYLGSDFSGRPNYLQRTDGAKFFFPEAASRMYVVAFFVYDERYLMSTHRELSVLGRTNAVCIFDVKQLQFIHCSAHRSAYTAQRPEPGTAALLPPRPLPGA